MRAINLISLIQSRFNTLTSSIKSVRENDEAITLTLESTILLLIGVLVALFIYAILAFLFNGGFGSSIGSRLFNEFDDHQKG